ncbi:SDR family oxidoreductase [Gynuella sunshinyii]|uniref:Dehydrogenases with different specificities (Related to short-chain alcohol dehydrogenase) n=1 Tax=Gynuella sunshinyii YC6258 TaxID=1445510 RepID=A0A0C5V6R4_9GAMM|nr:SDR family oxidoreductase [Gynuella sunshinyii]AJQ95125.1 dehydrogenases with different specificities (related to short-chain alcohol dehydrogenase) [Gynuella sunshinyii YC6258]
MAHHKTVLITGGSRGIGAETARVFAAQGYKVCFSYLSNQMAADAVVAEINSQGGQCIAVQANVAQEADIVRLFQTVDEQLGALSVLVNNAAILQQQCRLVDMTVDRLRAVLETNVIGSFLCCREAVRRMSTDHGGQGGVIVNVSSGAAKSGSPNEYVDYAASKGAIDTMTRGLALEVAAAGIRVNAVRPGMIYTEMHASGGEPGRVDRLKERIPLQRGGRPEEIAQAIYWLASDQTSYMTGSFIDLTGGL